MNRKIFSSVTESPEATGRLAAELANVCKAGDCLLLRGDLGAGKTAFARGFIGAACGGQEEVVSPTFTLVQHYPLRRGGMLWHFDLYRLQDAGEVEELGMADALAGGLTLVEWPQRAEGIFPAGALDISIAYGQHPGQRLFTFNGLPSEWQARMDGMRENRS